MRYSPENIITILILAFALYVLVARFRIRPDSNWPLAFYLLVVIYHQALPGRLVAMTVYAVVVTVLFLRFEFMGGWFLRLVRCVDIVLLCMLSWQLYNAAYF